MLSGKVNCSVAVKGDGGPHSLQLAPAFFYQNTKTTDSISALAHLSLECTRNIWQKTKAESQNCGHWTILISCPWNLLPTKSVMPPMSLSDHKQGLFHRKDLPDLQGICDFLLPFTIRH